MQGSQWAKVKRWVKDHLLHSFQAHHTSSAISEHSYYHREWWKSPPFVHDSQQPASFWRLVEESHLDWYASHQLFAFPLMIFTQMVGSTHHNSTTLTRKSTMCSLLLAALHALFQPSMINLFHTSLWLQPVSHLCHFPPLCLMWIAVIIGLWIQVCSTHFYIEYPLTSCWALAPAGHLVNVMLIYLNNTVSTAWAKTVPKKAKITKMDNLVLNSITCVNFIKAILKIQGLSDNFSLGVHSGLNFKLWWTGARFVTTLLQVLTNTDSFSSGGKVGALSIQNNHQFGVALDALKKKVKNKTQVSVEINLDDLEGFRIKQTVRNLNSYVWNWCHVVSSFKLPLLSPMWMVPEPWRSWLMEPE